MIQSTTLAELIDLANKNQEKKYPEIETVGIKNKNSFTNRVTWHEGCFRLYVYPDIKTASSYYEFEANTELQVYRFCRHLLEKKWFNKLLQDDILSLMDTLITLNKIQKSA